MLDGYCRNSSCVGGLMETPVPNTQLSENCPYCNWPLSDDGGPMFQSRKEHDEWVGRDNAELEYELDMAGGGVNPYSEENPNNAFDTDYSGY